MTEQDWRDSAYLTKSNWPEAIPPMGPKREYGPYPWGEPYDEHSNYPFSHPNAGSVGSMYFGDVCPQCGVPLRGDETVVNKHQTRGELMEVSPSDSPVACWHPECWRDYQARKGRAENKTLAGYIND